jgi:imidazolonepropionase-like amidohydrolase
MGNVAGYRSAWIKAKEYKDKGGSPRDLKLDTLKGVLDGEILIQNHCYRGEEMAVMLDIAEEFEYKVTTFHHAIEAYKVADILAENNVCAAMWADWWGFKHEAFDMVWENVAIVDQAKGGQGCAIVHSDSAVGIQRLNQEAAKAMAAGRRAGFEIPRKRAIQWITKNPAKALGILDKTGTIEKGKMADLVIWDLNPFSVYAKTEMVFVDGLIKYDHLDPNSPKATDFELGIIEPTKSRL